MSHLYRNVYFDNVHFGTEGEDEAPRLGASSSPSASKLIKREKMRLPGCEPHFLVTPTHVIDMYMLIKSTNMRLHSLCKMCEKQNQTHIAGRTVQDICPKYDNPKRDHNNLDWQHVKDFLTTKYDKACWAHIVRLLRKL